jgi:hypothetical protein
VLVHSCYVSLVCKLSHLADVLPPKPPVHAGAATATDSSPSAAPGAAVAARPPTHAAPASQRGRAMDVFPLHFTFATVPDRAPHAVDLRCLARDAGAPGSSGGSSGGGVAVRLGPGPEDGVPLALIGGTLVMDNADLALHTRDHLEAARRRIVAAKVGTLLGDVAPPPLLPSLPLPVALVY